MTVLLSVRVMAHPKRTAEAERLAGILGTKAKIVYDPEPAGTPSTWRTAREAWIDHDRVCTHALVLQDDVLPCRNFLAGVERVVAARPMDAITLYANRKEIEEAREAGRHWAPLARFLNSQAVVLPVQAIGFFIRFGDSYDETDPYDDTRLGAFLRDVRRPMWATAPSLVEHGLPSDSLMPHNNNRTRVARWFIGDDDPLLIDWTT